MGVRMGTKSEGKIRSVYKPGGCCLLAGLLLSALPGNAVAQGSPDASCTGPPPQSLFSTDGDARLAQPFVVQNSGQITSAQLTVDHNNPGDFVISIVTTPGGIPGDTVLASATIPDASIPGGSGVTLTANFATPPPVTAGEQFAVVITQPTSSQMDVLVRPSDDDCLGTLFVSDGPGMAYTPFVDGGGEGRDMIFTIFVGPVPSDTAAPDTTSPSAVITKGPKDKTRKKTATFEFTGTDTRAIASFQCKLDAGAFAPCTSPHTVKVKKGKHTFEVQAVDQAGNVGAPATDTWKVKKKRKK
jgi:hypothetical protein